MRKSPNRLAARLSALLLVAVVCFSTGCLRFRIAQRVDQVKANYNEGNFARVLGYAKGDEAPQSNNAYDPAGNFTVHEVRALLVKNTGEADYDYRHLFEPDAARKVSAERQEYLRQLAVIELRALVHQYFLTHAPPYADSHNHPFIRRATVLQRRLQGLQFNRDWEKAEVIASTADLALLAGQYEAAQAGYAALFDHSEGLSSAVLSQYAKRYIGALDNARGQETVNEDAEQKALFERTSAATLKKIATLLPNEPVGMYAGLRQDAEGGRPLSAFVTALLLWRRTDDTEVRRLTDRFVTLELENYWPAMTKSPEFKKLILRQWQENKK